VTPGNEKGETLRFEFGLPVAVSATDLPVALLWLSWVQIDVN
jgi:hypothetical protein